MSIAFIDNEPDCRELQRIRLCLSSFCDGSGQEREQEGGTRPGWRDFERVFAETLGGYAQENKEVFDILINSHDEKETDYGISVKSKELPINNFDNLDNGKRVYMELSNSPAKFWEALHPLGISEDDFRGGNHPKVIGETVLKVVEDWHASASVNHRQTKLRNLNLEKSIHLVVSYSKISARRPIRSYQIHSFPLTFPKDIIWKFSSPKCLRGYDPKHPQEAIIDWYALSGGQLKYYPKATTCLFKTTKFELMKPPVLLVSEKASRYWPEIWVENGGDSTITTKKLAIELQKMTALLSNQKARNVLNQASVDLSEIKD